MNGEESLNTTNPIFHNQYYEKYIQIYLDDELKRFIMIMNRDRTYNSNTQLQSWEDIVPKLCIVLKRIINEHFQANEKSIDFFHFESDSKITNTIKDLINKIEDRLNNYFTKSPPFTIYQFITTMFFLCDEDIENCVDKELIDKKINIKYNGLKKYIRKENDLVIQEITETDVVNVYHQEDEGDTKEISKNDIYAIKYLRSLLKIISIESSIEEVTKDLKSYGSKNIIPIKLDNSENIVCDDKDQKREEKEINDNEESIETDTDTDTSTNSIKMVKIPWYDPQIHSLETFHDTPPNDDHDSDNEEKEEIKHDNTNIESVVEDT